MTNGSYFDADQYAHMADALIHGHVYCERVKVYTMGPASKEICGGPHASNTAELVSFKIQKEESSSAGVRRIKAVIGAKPED